MYGKKSKLFCARNIIFLLITLFMSRSFDASEKALSVREQMVNNLMEYTPLPSALMTIVTEYALIDEARKNEIFSLLSAKPRGVYKDINDQQLDNLGVHELEEIIDEKEQQSGLYWLVERYMDGTSDDTIAVRRKMLEKIEVTIKKFPDSANVFRRRDQQPLCQHVAAKSIKLYKIYKARTSGPGCDSVEHVVVDHEIFDIFKASNVNWYTCSAMGWTSLMWLVAHRDLQFHPDPVQKTKDEALLKLLIGPPEKKIINAQLFLIEDTALHITLKRNVDEGIIRLLIEHKADPRIKGHKNKTAIELAIQNQRSKELRECLEKAAQGYDV